MTHYKMLLSIINYLVGRKNNKVFEQQYNLAKYYQLGIDIQKITQKESKKPKNKCVNIY